MNPRWYQKEASEALMNCLSDDKEKKIHPLVVAPTGSGKSLIICEFINDYISKYPLSKILVLSHVKEILSQDFNALKNYFEGIDVGLYSAGMNSRTIHRITVAGIQSVYRKADLFKDVGIVIIDECHLVTIRTTGMYRTFLDKINANYVGLTATHFRLGHGFIHEGEGALFNHIAFDLSKPDHFNRLVAEGYLTKLITKSTHLKLNPDKIKIVAGDYDNKELALAFDRHEITNIAIDEIIKFGENYKKWLVFAIDIEHAEHITASFIKKGINAAVVHSKMSNDNRDEVIQGFKDGKYKAIVNVNILTTGLDVPDIDLIAMLRPTQSPVVHVQTIGRGLRVAPGKEHCLVLDFSGNTMRLGPINDVQVKKKKKGQKGKPVVKVCPECKSIVFAASKICDICGFEFVFKTKLTVSADDIEVVKRNMVDWYKVNGIRYYLHHSKRTGRTSLKVKYKLELSSFSEYINYDHEGRAKAEADNWFRNRRTNGMPTPKDVEELYDFSAWLKQPYAVKINLTERYPKIREYRLIDPTETKNIN